MAGPEYKAAGFPDGLNNRAHEKGGPTSENGIPTALREAVNVSLTREGRPFRRPGQTQRVEGIAHSLYAMGQHLLAVVDGEFRAYRQADDGTLTLDVTIATTGNGYITCTDDDYSVFWSNGLVSGRLDEAFANHPLWIDTPNPVSLATTTGALAAGRYEVAVTVVDAEGRESGASGPVGRSVVSGQGLTVTLPAAPAGTVRWRLWITTPDGEVFYQAASLPANATSHVIGHLATDAKLETLWLHPLVPTNVLRHGHNRLYGLANATFIWSEPYRVGLMHPDNHMVLGTEATLLEPIGDGTAGAGLWIADHKRTYFLSSPDFDTWQQQARYPHAAVPGTSHVLPGSHFGIDAERVVYWLARNGIPCLGLPGGQHIPLREDAVALPVDAERGATGLMIFDGIRQLLTTTVSASANIGQAADSIDATVTRRDHRPT